MWSLISNNCLCFSGAAAGVSKDGPGENTKRRKRPGGVSAESGVAQGDIFIHT